MRQHDELSSWHVRQIRYVWYVAYVLFAPHVEKGGALMAPPQRKRADGSAALGAILPDDVPVEMPELPLSRVITTPEQFKAISHPTRSRILGIIQQQPATAFQIADRLGKPPGTIGHHLQRLEAAGLAQVVARRLVRGIVAKYYTRTARIFKYDLPSEVVGDSYPSLEIVTHAREELADSLAAAGKDNPLPVGFPHARLSPERLRAYDERLNALIDDFLAEPADPNGQVYGLCGALFLSPPYMQIAPPSNAAPGAHSPASARRGAP
jgi:DNA-binding transcriptional ArsR family regulator